MEDASTDATAAAVRQTPSLSLGVVRNLDSKTPVLEIPVRISGARVAGALYLEGVFLKPKRTKYLVLRKKKKGILVEESTSSIVAFPRFLWKDAATEKLHAQIPPEISPLLQMTAVPTALLEKRAPGSHSDPAVVDREAGAAERPRRQQSSDLGSVSQDAEEQPDVLKAPFPERIDNGQALGKKRQQQLAMSRGHSIARGRTRRAASASHRQSADAAGGNDSMTTDSDDGYSDNNNDKNEDDDDDDEYRGSD